jgi:S-adenosylmethionine decarboxylase
MARTNAQSLTSVGADYFIEKDGLTFAGFHLLLDLWGADNLTNPDQVEKVLCNAAEAAGAAVLHAHVHQFESGGGVSGVVVLAESHISIHTWPERKFAAIDIFMCGSCDPYKSIPKLREFFSPDKMNISEQKRGLV